MRKPAKELRALATDLENQVWIYRISQPFRSTPSLTFFIYVSMQLGEKRSSMKLGMTHPVSKVFTELSSVGLRNKLVSEEDPVIREAAYQGNCMVEDQLYLTLCFVLAVFCFHPHT